MSQLSVQQALDILQLQPGATAEQIRAAYKRLALKLHPDKLRHKQQQAQLQHQHHDKSCSSSHGSIAVPVDPAAAFNVLAAAYELLTSTQQSTAAASCIGGSCSSWPSFEAAYASGSLFQEQLLDQAVLDGLQPDDVAKLQQLCRAVALEQLAQQLQEQPPTVEDEQLWRQLYQQLTIKWQLEQLKQQQQREAHASQPGVGLVDMVVDLLFKPSGQIMVDVTDEETDDDDEQQQQQQQQCEQGQQQQHSAGRSMQPCSVGCQHQQKQRQMPPAGEPFESVHGQSAARSLRPSSSCEQSAQPSSRSTLQAEQLLQHQQSQQGFIWHNSSSSCKKKVQRHGLGFYWMWFRRLLVGKAVLSILTSKPTQKYEANVFAVL